MGQLAEVVRSYWLGPFGSGDRAAARFLTDSGPTMSGVSVNEQNALTIAAFWAGVRIISESVASLPLHLMKRLGDEGRERFEEHPLYKILYASPNPEMSSMVFRETMQAHVLTRGNAYAEIVRNGAGQVAALWPLHPSSVSWDRDRGGSLFYRVANADGTEARLRSEQMFHLRGLGGDGIDGYSVIKMARESLGLTKATELYGAAFFGNGAKPGGVLEHPARLSDPVKKALRENLEGIHRGVANSNKIAILEEGMKYHAISIPPEDAQFLSTREFQVVEVARWLNMSPTKLRDLSRSTFSNTEQEALDFAKFTLRPWLRRWEGEIMRSLIAPLERTQQYAQHVILELESADVLTRNNSYVAGRQWGWLSADDVRRLENMNPLPDGQGKLYLVPSNMAPADRVNDIIDAQVRPKPEPAALAPAKSDDEAQAERSAFLAHILPKLDDLARRVDGIDVPTAPAMAEALRAELAATDTRVEVVADLVRTQDAGARAAMAETLAKVDAVAAAVREAEARLHEVVVVASDERAKGVIAAVSTEVATKLAEQDERARTAADAVTLAVAETASKVESVAEQVAAAETAHAADAAATHAHVEATHTEMTTWLREQGELATASTEAVKQAVAESEARLVAAQVELRERLDASEAARKAQAECLARVAPTLLAVIDRDVRKEVRFEANRVRKETASPEKLRAWMETFYATREDACVTQLLPSMLPYFMLIGRAGDAEAETRRRVAAWIADSRAALEGMLASPTLDADVKALVARWEDERPKAMTDDLVREVIASA